MLGPRLTQDYVIECTDCAPQGSSVTSFVLFGPYLQVGLLSRGHVVTLCENMTLDAFLWMFRPQLLSYDANMRHIKSKLGTSV